MRYGDLLAKNHKIFFTTLSFSASVRGDPFRIYGTALLILKLKFSRQWAVKI